jgi:hypothetical protein
MATFLVGLFAMYPTMIILGFLSGVYRLVKQAGHWLCFGVTLITTMTSWFVFRHSFGNELAAWTVALITGIASGGLTETLRRPLAIFYENTKVGVWFRSSPWEKLVGSGEDGYMDFLFDRAAGFWFQQHRPARILRAMCFSTTIARPI